MKRILLSWNTLLQKAFFGVFAVSFSVIILGVMFIKDFGRYPVFLLMILTLLILLGICFLYRLFKMKAQFFTHHYGKILIGFAVFMFAIQMIIGSMLVFNPIFDLEAIYQGAKEWVATGTFGHYSSGTCYPDYFYIFPNNTGGLAFLALIFKVASLFGIHDTFAVATVVNGLLSVGTMVVTSLICKRLWGVPSAVLALLIFLISPPFYFIAPVFYTDSLSMIFPALVIFLFLKSRDSDNRWKKVIYFNAIGILATVGALIKFTVLIAVIAIAIYLIFTKNLKQAVLFTVSTGLTVALLLFSFNSYLYSTHLDQQKAEKVNTPYSYWFALGFQGNGTYNGVDFSLSRSIEDPAVRKDTLNKLVASRIKSLGVTGVLSLFVVKSTDTFGDGTYALSDFLDDNPQKTTALHSFLLYDGSNYKLYQFICNGVFLSVMILMLFSALQNLYRKTTREPDCFIPQLCVFGIMMFLLVWEMNSRYIMNFIPMIFISGVGGIDYFYEVALGGLRQKIRSRRAIRAVSTES